MQEKEKDKGGRPSLYKPEYAEQAYKYCLLGATDKELASFFNVCEDTIHNWKKDYPEFFESLKKGKEIANAEVAHSLYNRAKGCTVNTKQVFKIKEVVYNQNGERVEREKIEIIEVPQEQAPDTAAAFIWLKNRAPQYWRDKVETEHSGSIKTNLEINVLSEDAREGLKQLESKLNDENNQRI